MKTKLPADARKLRALLTRASLTQSSAATQIGIHPRTMRKYVCGENSVPTPVMMAVELLVGR